MAHMPPTSISDMDGYPVGLALSGVAESVVISVTGVTGNVETSHLDPRAAARLAELLAEYATEAETRRIEAETSSARLAELAEQLRRG